MSRLTPSTPERRRQYRLLAVLIIALAGVLAYRLWPAGAGGPSSDAGNGPSAAANGAPASGQAGPVTLPKPVKLGTLETPPELEDAGRNPFTFGVRPPPPPPPRPEAPPPAVAPPPVRPQGPPPIALKLVGVTVVPDGGRSLVTLKDTSGPGVYQAFEGDVVDGRYRVVKVGVQSVVVSYLDGSGTRTIPLGG